VTSDADRARHVAAQLGGGDRAHGGLDLARRDCSGSRSSTQDESAEEGPGEDEEADAHEQVGVAELPLHALDPRAGHCVVARVGQRDLPRFWAPARASGQHTDEGFRHPSRVPITRVWVPSLTCS
jgi:hypothetical protein